MARRRPFALGDVAFPPGCGTNGFKIPVFDIKATTNGK